jgi:AcrR family transcriptional regulator
MARPTVIDDDLLLTTAREVFLRRGLRATTAEIAEQAGVSQGILFKRFQNKQELFRAAMNLDEDPTKPLPINLLERVGHGKVEDTLKNLGKLLIKKFLGLIPAMMMDWSNSREDTETTCAKSGESGPERAVKGMRLIAEYLSQEGKLGRVRSADYEILAQTFIGALWHYALLQVTMGEVHKKPLSPEQYVDGVVRTLMVGIGTTGKKKG